MTNKIETCTFCIPQIKDIIDVVGGYTTDKELVEMRTGIEALGNVLKCGESRLTCQSLGVIHREIVRRRDGKK